MTERKWKSDSLVNYNQSQNSHMKASTLVKKSPITNYKHFILMATATLISILIILAIVGNSQVDECLQQFQSLNCQGNGNSDICQQLSVCILSTEENLDVDSAASLKFKVDWVWVGPFLGVIFKGWDILNFFIKQWQKNRWMTQFRN